MNRIEHKFCQLRQSGKKALIVYIGAGDPDLDATRELAWAFDEAGVDILELGVPFSDPLADGPINQMAAQRGLLSGTTPLGVFETVLRIRGRSEMPIVLYVYYNLVHRMGLEKFISEAARVGVDGLLVLDLPPEEASDYDFLMKQMGLCPIYLVAPTTPEERIAKIVQRAKGFIYYVSREGVTGMPTSFSEALQERVSLMRRYTDLPIVIGFGVATPEQARFVAQFADGVVVGSAVVKMIGEFGKTPMLVPKVKEFVSRLVLAVKTP